MSWVWLSPSHLEFGGREAAPDGAEGTVWLHADPLALLELPPGSSHDAIRRAYRRLALLRHPDAGESDEAFGELRCAYRAALGDDDPEVAVQPVAGAWWSFAGFTAPAGRSVPGRGAVVGLVFEVHDLDAVPLRRAKDLVHVAYAGQRLPLEIRYARAAAAPPVLVAKAARLLESTVLFLLCLALIPILALGLGLESYFLAGGSGLLFWAAAAGTLGLGYAALAAALATSGRPVPYPRRVVAKLRGRRDERRLLATRSRL